MNSDALRRLAALNLAPEAMAEVLSIFADIAAADEDRLRKQRERKAKSRAGHGTVTGQERDGHRDNPSPKEKSPTPPKETTPTHRSTKPTVSTTDIAREFADDFWPAYPNKVGKPKAALAFDRARRKATLPVILAGLDRYVRDKPADRSWCNPETWLNQERWADQPAPVQQATGPPVQKHGFAAISAALHRASHEPPRQPAADYDLDLSAAPADAGVLPLSRFRSQRDDGAPGRVGDDRQRASVERLPGLGGFEAEPPRPLSRSRP